MNPRPFEVGERVFDVTIGWGTVTRIMPYEVRVQPNEGSYPRRSYHADGRYFSTNKYRSLYHADEIVDGVLRIQVEPKKVKWWVYAYKKSGGGYDFVGYASKEEAEDAKQDNPFAVSEIKEIEIELEEER